MKAHELSYDDIRRMQNHLVGCLIQYAKDNGITGLSHAGWFSFYDAVDIALEEEWKKTQNVPRSK